MTTKSEWLEHPTMLVLLTECEDGCWCSPTGEVIFTPEDLEVFAEAQFSSVNAEVEESPALPATVFAEAMLISAEILANQPGTPALLKKMSELYLERVHKYRMKMAKDRLSQ